MTEPADSLLSVGVYAGAVPCSFLLCLCLFGSASELSMAPVAPELLLLPAVSCLEAGVSPRQCTFTFSPQGEGLRLCSEMMVYGRVSEGVVAQCYDRGATVTWLLAYEAKIYWFVLLRTCGFRTQESALGGECVVCGDGAVLGMRQAGTRLSREYAHCKVESIQVLQQGVVSVEGGMHCQYSIVNECMVRGLTA
jgi:hypothetical protein